MDRKACFLFVGHMNAYHVEWFGSSMTNLRGRAGHDFALVLGCEQMVTKPTHIDGGVLNLVLIDVPDVVGVRIGSAIGTVDHGAIFINVLLEQPIPFWCVGRNSISRRELGAG